jgi:hypothetical protein
MIEYRQMTLADFDNKELINSIYDLHSFVSKDLSISDLKIIFKKRLTTDTFIAVDTEKSVIAAHAAVCTYHSFSGDNIGILNDVTTNNAYPGTAYKLAFFARDEAGKKHNLVKLGGAVHATMVNFYAKGGAVKSNDAFYEYTYPPKPVPLM